MKQYTVENDIGKRITFEWEDDNTPPTDSDFEEVFRQAEQFKPAELPIPQDQSRIKVELPKQISARTPQAEPFGVFRSKDLAKPSRSFAEPGTVTQKPMSETVDVGKRIVAEPQKITPYTKPEESFIPKKGIARAPQALGEFAQRQKGIIGGDIAQAGKKLQQVSTPEIESSESIDKADAIESGRQIATRLGITSDEIKKNSIGTALSGAFIRKYRDRLPDQKDIEDLSAYGISLLEQKKVELGKAEETAGKKAVGESLEKYPAWLQQTRMQEQLDKLETMDPSASRSLKRGDLGGTIDIMIADAAITGDEDFIRRAKELKRQFAEEYSRQDTEEKKAGVLKYYGSKTLEIIPMMARSMAMEAPAALIPGAGPAKIAKAATRAVGSVASLGMWSKQGAGDMYDTMTEEGVPHDVALALSIGGSIPYAFVEKAQIKSFGDPGVRKAVSKSFAGYMAKQFAGKMLKDLPKESIEEGLQQWITSGQAINAFKTAGMDDKAAAAAERQFKDGYKAAIEAGVVFAPLNLLGLARGSLKYRRQKETTPEVEKPGEVELGKTLRDFAVPTAEAYYKLPEDKRNQIFPQLSPDEQTRVMEAMPDEVAQEGIDAERSRGKTEEAGQQAQGLERGTEERLRIRDTQTPIGMETRPGEEQEILERAKQGIAPIAAEARKATIEPKLSTEEEREVGERAKFLAKRAAQAKEREPGTEQPSDQDRATGEAVAKKYGLRFKEAQEGDRDKGGVQLVFDDPVTGKELRLSSSTADQDAAKIADQTRKENPEEFGRNLAKQSGVEYVGRKEVITGAKGVGGAYNTEIRVNLKTQKGNTFTVPFTASVDEVISQAKNADKTERTAYEPQVQGQRQGETQAVLEAPGATPVRPTRDTERMLNMYVTTGKTETGIARDTHDKLVRVIDQVATEDIAEAAGITEEEARLAIQDIRTLKKSEASQKVRQALAPSLFYGESVDEAVKGIKQPRTAGGEVMFQREEPVLNTREDVDNWIKEKSKEYGSKNEFLSSEEYRKLYPKVKEAYSKKTYRKATIEKYNDGYAIKISGAGRGYVAQGKGGFGGLASGVAVYKTEKEAIDNAEKYGYTVEEKKLQLQREERPMDLETAKAVAQNNGLEYVTLTPSRGGPSYTFRDPRTGTEFKATTRNEVIRAAGDLVDRIAPRGTTKAGTGVRFEREGKGRTPEQAAQIERYRAERDTRERMEALPEEFALWEANNKLIDFFRNNGYTIQETPQGVQYVKDTPENVDRHWAEFDRNAGTGFAEDEGIEAFRKSREVPREEKVRFSREPEIIYDSGTDADRERGQQIADQLGNVKFNGVWKGFRSKDGELYSAPQLTFTIFGKADDPGNRSTILAPIDATAGQVAKRRVEALRGVAKFQIEDKEGVRFSRERKNIDEDDFYDVYYTRHDEILEKTVDDALSVGKKKQTWDPLKPQRLEKIWRDYARTGVVRDETGLDEIADDFLNKIITLDVNTILAGHEAINPVELVEEKTGKKLTKKDLDRIASFIETPEGGWRISDYGLSKLKTLAERLIIANSYESKLLILDQMLNVAHQRSDLASWFVEGGRESLDKLSEGGIRFSRERQLADPFFSPTLKAVQGLKQERGTGDQMFVMITKTPGVKEAEWKWMGLDDFLKGKQSVTKGEIEEFVRGNQVRVEEVGKGGKERRDLKIERSWKPNLFNVVDSDGNIIKENVSQTTASETVDTYWEGKGDTKFSQYTLPGGENYREMLLTLPGEKYTKDVYSETKYENVHPDRRAFEDLKKSFREKYQFGEREPLIFDELSDADKIAYHKAEELAKNAPSPTKKTIYKKAPVYKSGHWDEPNVIAHVRMNDRTGPNGERVLFVEEIQSDWAREAREKGVYDDAQKFQLEAFNRAEHEYEAAQDEVGRLFENGEDLGFDTAYQVRDAIRQHSDFAGRWEVSDEMKKAGDELRRAYSVYTNEAEKRAGIKKGVPAQPFLKNWEELTLKRVLRMAAEEGYDRVAWINGQQTKERYREAILNVIDRLHYSKTEDGRYDVTAYKGNNVVDVERTGRAGIYTEEELSKTFGKDISESIVKGEGKQSDNFPKIKELDVKGLTLGGEWATALYDRMIPKFLEKYGKKWGTKVEPIKIQTLEKGLATVVDENLLREAANNAKKVGDNDSNIFLVAQADKMAKGQEPNYGIYNSNMPASKYVNDLRGDLSPLTPQQSIPITPEMKESVLYEGQPMFQRERLQEAPGRNISPEERQTRRARREAMPTVMALEAAVNRLSETPLPEGSFTEVETPKGELYDVANGIAQEFGKNVVYFRQSEDARAAFPIGGAVLESHPNDILVNETTKKPVVVTVIHETMHRMQAERPDLYRTVKGYMLEQQTPEFEAYRQQMIDKGYTEEEAIDELVAEISGERFTDRDFLKGLAERSPEGFRQFIETLRDVIRQAIQWIKRSNIQHAAKYFRDLEGVDRRLQEALTEYQKAGGEAEYRMAAQREVRASKERVDQTTTPEFKRFFGDWENDPENASKVVDADGKPLVVYHGTWKPGFNEFKGNAAYFTENSKYAESYTGADVGENAAIYSVYLNIKKPLDLTYLGEKKIGWKKFISELENNGVELPIEAKEVIHSNIEDPIWAYMRKLSDVAPSVFTKSGFDGIIQKEYGKKTFIILSPEKGLEKNRIEKIPEDAEIFKQSQNLYFIKIPSLSGQYIGSGENIKEAKESALMTINRYFNKNSTQIKSATGNRGTFDPENPDIRFQREDINTIPNETKTQYLTRRVIDKFERLRILQRHIGTPASDKENAYLAQELMHGKIEEQTRAVERDYLEPLEKELAKNKISLADLDLFLYARHAEDRNRIIADRNQRFRYPEMYAFGSGMSDERAKAELQRFEKIGKIEAYKKLADMVYALNEKRLKIMIDGDLISTEQADAWRTEFGKYYVPLKGISPEMTPAQVRRFAVLSEKKAKGPLTSNETEEFDRLEELNQNRAIERPRIGRGFSIRGKEQQAAIGRRSEAQNILANVISNLNGAIIRAEKNRVAKAMLEYVRGHKNPALWEIEPMEEKPRFNTSTGEVEYREQPLRAYKDRSTGQTIEPMVVKEGGKATSLLIKDPILANSMQNLGSEKMGKLIQNLAVFSRYFSLINTQVSPEFIITNLTRDIQTALVNTVGVTEQKNLKGAAKDVAKNIPRAIKGAWDGLHGNEDTEWSKWFREYEKAGGRVGWFGLDTVEDIQKRLTRHLEELKDTPRSNALRVWNKSVELVKNLNGSVENATRLSVYVAMRKRGLTESQAASVAKNITVNFNKHGELGPIFNSLYAFSNASIQGSARLVQALKSRRVQLLAASAAAASFALAQINRALSGDDDDGEANYSKIPHWEKQNNMVIMLGQGRERIKIPLPYGYNVFWAIGQGLDQAIHETPERAASTVAGSIANSFNPLGNTGSLTQTAFPTAARWIVDLGVNRDFSGKPILKEEKYGAPKSQAFMAKKSTTEISKNVAKTIAYMSGGREYEPGLVEKIPNVGKFLVSPDAYDYVFEYFTGGIGRFATNSMRTMQSVAQSKTPELPYLPFVRRYYGTSEEYVDVQRFYENIEKLEKARAQYKLYLENEQEDKAAEYEKVHKKEIEYFGAVGRLRKGLSNLRKQRDQYDKQGRTKESDEIDKQVIEIMKNFNKELNK